MKNKLTNWLRAVWYCRRNAKEAEQVQSDNVVLLDRIKELLKDINLIIYEPDTYAGMQVVAKYNLHKQIEYASMFGTANTLSKEDVEGIKPESSNKPSGLFSNYGKGLDTKEVKEFIKKFGPDAIMKKKLDATGKGFIKRNANTDALGEELRAKDLKQIFGEEKQMSIESSLDGIDTVIYNGNEYSVGNRKHGEVELYKDGKFIKTVNIKEVERHGFNYVPDGLGIGTHVFVKPHPLFDNEKTATNDLQNMQEILNDEMIGFADYALKKFAGRVPLKVIQKAAQMYRNGDRSYNFKGLQ